MNTKNGNYGLDAPLVIRNLLLVGVVSIFSSVAIFFFLRSFSSNILFITGVCALIIGIILLACGGLLIWSSKVGKIQLREEIIDSLNLYGSEVVVDVGCGRGLLLNAVARRLTSGKAIGVDLWQVKDQSGNHPETTLKNARIEGVLDRVDIKTGDMRELPLIDHSVDLIVSSLAIHNIPDKISRAKAIQEIIRVLKPGGRVALLDYRFVREYFQSLSEKGCSEVKISRFLFKMFPPVRIVSGTKII